MIAAGALYLANKNFARIRSSTSGSVTTMNSHGWELQAVGAAIAAFNNMINAS
jgi:hypothetical protein